MDYYAKKMKKIAFLYENVLKKVCKNLSPRKKLNIDNHCWIEILIFKSKSYLPG